MIRCLALTAAILATGSLSSRADDTDAPGPISLKITLAVDEFDVQTNGWPLHVFEEKVREFEKDKEPLPASAMELVLEFKNNTSEPIRMLVGGDETLLNYELVGKASLTAEAPVKREPRIAAQVVTIPAGGVYRIAREDLSHGFRNKSKQTYLSGIGVYQLTATYQTSISPAPSNAVSNGRSGFGEIKIKSAPVEFRTKKPS